MKKTGAARVGFAPAVAGAFGLLVAGCTAATPHVPATNGIGSANAGSLSHTTAPKVPFEKLVTRITWPRGQDGTDKSLIAYGPSEKHPAQGYSSQRIWWTVDVTAVAAVDVSINGGRVDNPRDVKQAHTAIYRLGGQTIPGYNGDEGYFSWTIWPAGEFKFDFAVYDDRGNVIGTLSHSVTVAPMPPNT